MKEIRIVATGTRPLLMHNVRMASPWDSHARELKELNSNRTKTDEIRARMARVEWEGGLYWRDPIGPYLPSANLHASLIGGGKATRDGKNVERAVTIVEFELPVIYKGPRDIEGLWGDGIGRSPYVDSRIVAIQRDKVERTRPIFPVWAVEATVLLNDELLDYDKFVTVAHNAGKFEGLGDFRKLYGRYEVELTEL